MPEWLSAIGTALPVVGVLAAIVWALIVFHGDSRWQRAEDAKKMQSAIDTQAALLVGQNDKTADHEGRLARLEELDQVLFTKLDSIGEKLGDVSDRLIRMETRWSDGRRRNDSQT